MDLTYFTTLEIDFIHLFLGLLFVCHGQNLDSIFSMNHPLVGESFYEMDDHCPYTNVLAMAHLLIQIDVLYF